MIDDHKNHDNDDDNGDDDNDGDDDRKIALTSMYILFLLKLLSCIRYQR
jgi:hypothetical protein